MDKGAKKRKAKVVAEELRKLFPDEERYKIRIDNAAIPHDMGYEEVLQDPPFMVVLEYPAKEMSSIGDRVPIDFGGDVEVRAVACDRE